LGGTIDELFEADVMREIFGLVALARKVGDRLGVIVECLAGVEGAESIRGLCDGSPMGALEGCDRCA
jgi:hypothetical protein